MARRHRNLATVNRARRAALKAPTAPRPSAPPRRTLTFRHAGLSARAVPVSGGYDVWITAGPKEIRMTTTAPSLPAAYRAVELMAPIYASEPLLIEYAEAAAATGNLRTPKAPTP